MGQFAFTAIALALCSVLLWQRISVAVHRVRFFAFSGSAHDVNSADPGQGVAGAPKGQLQCFALRGAGFDLGQLYAHDSALGICPGHRVTAVYADRNKLAPQPALLFNHASARWRSMSATWAALRGGAASHFLPVLAGFLLIDIAVRSLVSSGWVWGLELNAGIDPTLQAFLSALLAWAVFSALSAIALRLADVELERRAVAALHDALFLHPRGPHARTAHVNLAEPRTRYAPQTLDLVIS